MKEWNGKRYHSFNYYLRNKYKEKVYKIALDGGFTCPNRDGKAGKGGCTFCTARGSGDFAGSRLLTIGEQFDDRREMMEKKWATGKLIAYFQAYTNTYAPIEELREKYEEALKQPNVVALSIATRPDCVGDDVLDLLTEMNEKIHLIVELGLQTTNNETARAFNRGYDTDVFEDTLKRLKSRNIEVVTHTIFGLPGETEEDMMRTVDYVANSGTDGVKFHLLHVMKHTPMAKQLERGEFELLSQEKYIDLLCKAIVKLPENMVVHRLTGDAPRELLIGPMWSLKKWEVLNAIDKAFVDNDIWQGKEYKEIEA